MLVSALLAPLAVSACDPPAEGLRAASQPVPDLRIPTSQTRLEPGSPPRRGRLIAGERVERVPQWPPASELAQGLRSRAPTAVLAAVDRSPVPVLLPGDPAWLARAELYVPPDPKGFGYAFSGHAGTKAGGERHVSVQASRIATLLPHIGHIRGSAVRSGEGSFSVNEGVRTASWIEHGVAYSLELECFDPDAPTCDEAALRGLVAGLVYVGGAAAVGGAQ
jgi:hypothetical protein